MWILLKKTHMESEKTPVISLKVERYISKMIYFHKKIGQKINFEKKDTFWKFWKLTH
jgi:hypothetical protein